MDPAKWRQAKSLIAEALERPVPDRDAFLLDRCSNTALLAEVRSLLANADSLTRFLESTRVEPLARGTRFGPYELVSLLGRGGMGSVYLAVRTDDVYRKSVAIKIVRPDAGEDILQRFRQERQIVAALDHPSIARLLDGGATPEGVPYFVMDYVQGLPIDAYCDAHRLTVTERLKLFQTVCVAVEYAHGSGVVHRDLKPGNILVTSDGAVKLLDFGIAKLLHRDAPDTRSITRTGLRLMTPEYASPEQVRGDRVDRATDVYSLAVILYELLTGHRPYRMRSRLIHEVVREICEDEPLRPSSVIKQVEPRADNNATSFQVTPQSVSRKRQTTVAELGRKLSGDVDDILLFALRKDPLARYRSVQAFNDDVQRHLDGLPVVAQGPGVVYRVGRLLRRHGTSVTAVVLVAGGLMTGSIALNRWAANFLLLLLMGLTVRYSIWRLEFGADVAGSLIARRVVPATLVLASLVFIVFALVESGLAQMPDRGLVLSQTPMLLIDAVGLTSAVGLLLWPVRRRWSGARLVDVSRPRGGGAHVFLGLMSLTMLLYLSKFVSTLSHPTLIPLFYSIGWAPFTAYMYGLWGRVEIRERGIVSGRGLLRWKRIEWYGWEQPGGEFALLKLRVRSFLPFAQFATRQLFVPAERQPEADLALEKQLAEWPGATISESGT